MDIREHSVEAKNAIIAHLSTDLIGSGAYRHVYGLAGRPDCVLKVEYGQGTHSQFHNVAEWHTWCEVEQTQWAKWFAPCVSIDGVGVSMVQRRTQPLTEWPQAIRESGLPALFTDVKLANWGLLDGRAVCHDYGYNSLMPRGLRRVKMVPLSVFTGPMAPYRDAA